MPSSFVKHNAAGQVPVLLIDGKAVAERRRQALPLSLWVKDAPDTYDPERLTAHFGAARLKPQRNAAPLRPYPPTQMAACMRQAFKTRKNLKEPGLMCRAIAEISGNGAGERFAALAHHVVEAIQPIDAGAHIGRPVAPMRSALKLQQALGV